MSSSTPKPSNKRSRKEGKGEEEAQEKTNTGLDEIDALFADKKRTGKAKCETNQQVAKKRQEKKKNVSSRQQLDKLNEHDWIDDGLGGKFNKDGFTGRREDGVRVYKAHVLNKKDFGNSPDCPFDCDCCYI
jgi:hypothetical protein